MWIRASFKARRADKAGQGKASQGAVGVNEEEAVGYMPDGRKWAILHTGECKLQENIRARVERYGKVVA